MFKNITKTFLVLITVFALFACDSSDNKKKRWATDGDVNLELDLDKVQKAFFDAKGPTEFEKTVNELYTGDEIIYISVKDRGKDKQDVIGFIDKNDNKVYDTTDDKVFTLTRGVVEEGQGDKKKMHYTMHGHGPYSSYHHSGVHSFVMGAAVGMMFHRMMQPNYTYSPPAQRYSRTQRDAYRKTQKYNSVKNNNKNLGKSGKYGSASRRRGSFRGGSRRAGGGSRGFGGK